MSSRSWGGGNIIDKVVCKRRVGSDIDKYVIATLTKLRDGWEPPMEVSRETYQDVRQNPEKYPDYLVGYVGYEISFAAKWFSGYVPRSDTKHRGDIYSFRSCMRQAPRLKGIEFDCRPFDTYTELHDCVIYCDPPYAEATKYKGDTFDDDTFYDWCRRQSAYNTVLVSEYHMPDDFECIWEKEWTVTVDANRRAGDKRNKRTERLYICR